MNNVNILTVSEITSFAPELDVTSYDVPTISGMISQATQNVSDFVGFSPYAEDLVNEKADGKVTVEGDLLIFPRKIPVISVSAIAITKGTQTIDFTLQSAGVDRYNLDYTGRTIRLPYGELSVSGNVIFTSLYSLRNTQFYTKISYRAGYEVSDLPAVFKQAALLYFRDIVSQRMNQTGATQVSQGQISFGYESGLQKKSKFVLDAERVLRPYRNLF